MVLSIILTSSFQIKEFTEIQSLQNLEMPQMNLDQKPERKRDKIKKGIRKVSNK